MREIRPSAKLTFALAMLAALIVSIFAIYPQFRLAQLRGSQYSGTFATYDLDEMAYAAYLRAIIDGRPRKNDPYTGRDDTSQSPQAESLFSIQFITAYFISVPARLIGADIATTMVSVSLVSAIGTAAALFLFIYLFTRDPWLAFAGSLTVIVGGALVSDIGAIGWARGGGDSYPFFPFLRRYIPSLSFPFLFLFFAAVWKGLDSSPGRPRVVFGAAAVTCFNVLLYSYFYLWTTAATVMLMLTLLIAVSLRENLRYCVAVGLGCVISIIPYALLVSQRSETLDKTQLLVISHSPDLTRSIEVVGIALIFLPLLLTLISPAALGRRSAAMLAAFAGAPLLVFNQQVITGRSLQPFHYQFYSMNYVVALALVLGTAAILKWIFAERRRSLVIIAVIWSMAAVAWGTIEAVINSRLWDDANVARDEAAVPNRYLESLAAASIEGRQEMTTLNFDSLQADSQPSESGIPVLWARHQHVFSGIADQRENMERYFKLIYYADLDGNWLKTSLKDCQNIEACMALFGWDRFNPTLSGEFRPLTQAEIEGAAADFDRFSTNLKESAALEPRLAFLIRRAKGTEGTTNLSKWYEVGEPIAVGEFVIHRLKARVK